MAGESEETISESRSTEELLAETEDLLSETGGASGAGASGRADSHAGRSRDTGDGRTSTDPDAGRSADASPSTGAATTDRSWLSRLRPSVPTVGLSSYFSPRAFVGLLVALGVGYVGGGMVPIPFGGSLLGLFVVAFVIGVATSKRRYTEMTAAGSAVGALTALASYLPLVLGGVGDRIVLVGVGASVLACLIGYYFGRDLRDGLSREV
ncbi:hypothetical protein [Halovivax cerinus]|uniref:DUF456 domain-containing protein n=1 Tax=Halovivax cerinus TaxID=1487865 RepID=A0ABD5NJC3_9EURY|nr:hypothetical protein [Halovivax cerinus]